MQCLFYTTIIFVGFLVMGAIAPNLPTPKILSTTSASAEMISPLPTGFWQESQKPSPGPALVVPGEDWEAIKANIRRIAPVYDFPVKVAIAQAALESGRGNSTYCRVRRNCFGINAVDWNPDLAYWFSSYNEGVIEYMRLIKHNFPEAYEARSNPDRMIELLKENSEGKMYATDPDYVTKLRSLPEWREEK
jgi:hypothetical protein